MARIIKPGPTSQVTLRRECPRCHSIVEFEVDDLVQCEVGSHPDYCTCPSCRHHVIIDPEERPPAWDRVLAHRDFAH